MFPMPINELYTINNTGMKSMQQFSKTNYDNTSVDIVSDAKKSFGYSIMILCAMTMNYIINIINSYVLYYVLMLFVMIFFLYTAKYKLRFFDRGITFKWFVALMVVTISTLRTPFTINTCVGMYTFAAGFVIFLCCGNDLSDFDLGFKLIKLLSIYYAVSIWIQIFIPSAYSTFVRLIPDRNREFIASFESNNIGFTGFTTNPGFTAGYIIIGLLLYISKSVERNKNRSKHYSLIILFLIISLIMTGKRGHLLAFVFSSLVLYVVSAPRKDGKLGRLAKLSVGLIVLVFLLVIFNEVLGAIPVFGRLYESFYGIIAGEDITNNRSILYGFGLQLFKENPLFGVGWLQYRQLAVGNITLVTTINTHNIYLQMLCETGIIGFLCLMVFMISELRRAFTNIEKVKMQDNLRPEWKTALMFSLGYQIFFMIYGISGNPLYDQNYFLMYLLALCIGHVFSNFTIQVIRFRE